MVFPTLKQTACVCRKREHSKIRVKIGGGGSGNITQNVTLGEGVSNVLKNNMYYLNSPKVGKLKMFDFIFAHIVSTKNFLLNISQIQIQIKYIKLNQII